MHTTTAVMAVAVAALATGPVAAQNLCADQAGYLPDAVLHDDKTCASFWAEYTAGLPRPFSLDDCAAARRWLDYMRPVCCPLGDAGVCPPPPPPPPPRPEMLETLASAAMPQTGADVLTSSIEAATAVAQTQASLTAALSAMCEANAVAVGVFGTTAAGLEACVAYLTCQDYNHSDGVEACVAPGTTHRACERCTPEQAVGPDALEGCHCHDCDPNAGDATSCSDCVRDWWDPDAEEGTCLNTLPNTLGDPSDSHTNTISSTFAYTLFSVAGITAAQATAMIDHYPGLFNAVNHGTLTLSGEFGDFALIGARNFGTVVVADAAPDALRSGLVVDAINGPGGMLTMSGGSVVIKGAVNAGTLTATNMGKVTIVNAINEATGVMTASGNVVIQRASNAGQMSFPAGQVALSDAVNAATGIITANIASGLFTRVANAGWISVVGTGTAAGRAQVSLAGARNTGTFEVANVDVTATAVANAGTLKIEDSNIDLAVSANTGTIDLQGTTGIVRLTGSATQAGFINHAGVTFVTSPPTTRAPIVPTTAQPTAAPAVSTSEPTAAPATSDPTPEPTPTPTPSPTLSPGSSNPTADPTVNPTPAPPPTRPWSPPQHQPSCRQPTPPPTPPPTPEPHTYTHTHTGPPFHLSPFPFTPRPPPRSPPPCPAIARAPQAPIQGRRGEGAIDQEQHARSQGPDARVGARAQQIAVLGTG